MEPRPILLVATEADGRTPILDGSIAANLQHEGYIVLHCPPEKMKSFRVLAPCPFDQADVDALRLEAKRYRQHLGAECEVRAAGLESIAARMEAML